MDEMRRAMHAARSSNKMIANIVLECDVAASLSPSVRPKLSSLAAPKYGMMLRNIDMLTYCFVRMFLCAIDPKNRIRNARIHAKTCRFSIRLFSPIYI